MIIDTHVHIGGKTLNEFYMTKEMTLQALTRYNIDYAIVSSVDCVECDHSQKILPADKQVSQLDALNDLLDFSRLHSDRIGVAVWVKPLTERLTNEFIDLISKNRDIIYAIKLHPFHSNIRPTDKKTLPYIELARDLGLAVVSHTGGCEAAEPKHLLELARMFPTVNIVMVHLGLGTDNSEAIKLLTQADNLYGDTTWVKMDSTLQIVKLGLGSKLVFGSDTPIDGVDTYAFNKFGERSLYQDYFHILPNLVSRADYEKIMFANSLRIFKIEKTFR